MKNEPRLVQHSHCWHPYRGPFLEVLPDGHVLLKCCHCEASKTEHREHLHEHVRRVWW